MPNSIKKTHFAVQNNLPKLFYSFIILLLYYIIIILYYYFTLINPFWEAVPGTVHKVKIAEKYFLEAATGLLRLCTP